MSKMKIAFCAIGTLALLVSLSFGLSALGLVHMSTFAPWRMSIDREVQVQSRQFVEAKQTALLLFVEKYEEAKANGQDAHAEAILRRIRMEAALIPESSIPSSILQYVR